ncbi:MAG TPA: phosphoribosyltransferase family protein, partial [Bacilli bacterium]|nr:phosphoribosyltransferase family protein [Bacilli bacterium]
LHFDERQNVIDKLEVVKGERVRDKKILLVDDLFTTGATVKAMIKLLKPYNPKKIQVLTLAYTKISDHHAPSGQD